MKLLWILMAFLIPFSVYGKSFRLENDVLITPLSDDIYLHTSYFKLSKWGRFVAHGLISTKNQEAVLIDTAWTNQQTTTILNWLRAQNFEVKGMVATHFHDDSIGGIKVLHEQGIPTFGNTKTIALVSQRGGIPPQNGIESNLFSWKIGTQTIELFYPGPGHTADNWVAWFPEEKILFAGDLARPLSFQKSLGNTADADVGNWSSSIEKLLGRYAEAKVVISKHGKPGNQELLHHTLQLIRSEKTRSRN